MFALQSTYMRAHTEQGKQARPHILMDEILHQSSTYVVLQVRADPRAPQLNVVSGSLCVMQDFGNSFCSDAFPQLNVKEGARGYTWVCSSSGAGFYI